VTLAKLIRKKNSSSPIIHCSERGKAGDFMIVVSYTPIATIEDMPSDILACTCQTCSRTLRRSLVAASALSSGVSPTSSAPVLPRQQGSTYLACMHVGHPPYRQTLPQGDSTCAAW